MRQDDVRGAGAGLTVRCGRRTCTLQGVLQAVALALVGRAGARLTGHLACAVSRSTLVRLIRAAADPDDQTRWCWASMISRCARGHVYGTILVNIETRRPVDMLPERSAESFRAWLDAHQVTGALVRPPAVPNQIRSGPPPV